MFRGQRDAEWRLQPSLYRDSEKNLFPTLSAWRHFSDLSDFREISFAECRLLMKFAEEAYRTGLPVPLRSDMDSLQRLANANVLQFSNFNLSLVALAQHYGIPTRLLDWTSSAFAAAYFAAREAANNFDGTKVKTTNRLAVWAVQRSLFKSFHVSSLKKPGLASTRPDNSINSNMIAQRGTFILNMEDIKFDMPNQPPDYLSGIQDLATSNGTLCFIKYTLPVIESFELLRLLSGVGVSGSTLFPGYSGVVDTVLESRHLH